MRHAVVFRDLIPQTAPSSAVIPDLIRDPFVSRAAGRARWRLPQALGLSSNDTVANGSRLALTLARYDVANGCGLGTQWFARRRFSADGPTLRRHPGLDPGSIRCQSDGEGAPALAAGAGAFLKRYGCQWVPGRGFALPGMRWRMVAGSERSSSLVGVSPQTAPPPGRHPGLDPGSIRFQSGGEGALALAAGAGAFLKRYGCQWVPARADACPV